MKIPSIVWLPNLVEGTSRLDSSTDSLTYDLGLTDPSQRSKRSMLTHRNPLNRRDTDSQEEILCPYWHNRRTSQEHSWFTQLWVSSRNVDLMHVLGMFYLHYIHNTFHRVYPCSTDVTQVRNKVTEKKSPFRRKGPRKTDERDSRVTGCNSVFRKSFNQYMFPLPDRDQPNLINEPLLTNHSLIREIGDNNEHCYYRYYILHYSNIKFTLWFNMF